MDLSKKRNGRRQYLITYSQCDEEIFPTRESFGKMLEEEFNAGPSAVKVSHWACCKEPHKLSGSHYHCAIKLTGVKKWVAVKERIQKAHKISVNFSDSHDYYLSAYRYVTKQDQSVAHSEGHPNLSEASSPSTKKSIAGNKRKSSTGNKFPRCKQQQPRTRLTNQDFAMFVRKNKIRSYNEVLALAEERREEGQQDLSNFVFNKQEKHIRELIVKSWQMAEAQKELKKKSVSRIDKLTDFLNNELCICEGEWLLCAEEILRLNNVPKEQFKSGIRNSLEMGRGKFRNIFIVGPTNGGKTFMLKPLVEIFRDEIFENPANHKYGWVGAENGTVFMLQDFRWSKVLVSWKDWVLLLESHFQHPGISTRKRVSPQMLPSLLLENMR